MASEKRLIWDEDAKRHIIALATELHTDRLPVDMVINIILHQAPTVDAVEVVHGRWKHQYEKGMSYKVCSICGCRNGLDLKFNYCPNCGAKMDGERKDNESETHSFQH